MKLLVINNVDIDELGLSVRAWNCLRRANINTVQDIVDNYDNLTRVRNLGQKAYDEVVEKIKPYTRTVSEDNLNPMSDRLTTDKTKIFVRECPTLMSVTKDEVRRHYNEIFDRLQEYEVAEEQGQIIVPPCKVGDKVWIIDWCDEINCYEVTHVRYNKDLTGQKFSYDAIMVGKNGADIGFFDSDIGKYVFPTKEEAVQALKEGVE